VAASELVERAGRVLIEAVPAPAKVILFGSHARGDADHGSDLDFRRLRRMSSMSQPSDRQLGGLSASPDVQAAAWISVALCDFDGTVGSVVPPVFETYARVFHPASRGSGDEQAAVRWAEVAAANGREMHPAAEWGSITGSWEYQHNSSQPGLWDEAPSTGQMPMQVACRLAAILSKHTEEADHACFGVWDGWGTGAGMFFFPANTREVDQQRVRDAYDAEAAAWSGLITSAASFQVPDRRMHLLLGPLAAIEDFYARYGGPSSLCLREPPSLWWPGDRTWCVGTDIDLMTTYVGASNEAVKALLADDQLEVLPVPDNQSVTWEADTINPLPRAP
jgi:hypothetical protein